MYKMIQKMAWSEQAHVLCGSIFVLLCSAVVTVRERTQSDSLTHLLFEHQRAQRHATLQPTRAIR